MIAKEQGAYLLGKDESEKIIEFISDVILKQHSVVSEDRKDKLSGFYMPSSSIELTIVNDGESLKTLISFCSGPINKMQLCEEKAIIDGEIDKETINQIIKFILSHCDNVHNLILFNDIIMLSFKPSDEKLAAPGIECGEITLYIKIRTNNNQSELRDYYFDGIKESFYDKIRKTDVIQREEYRQSKAFQKKVLSELDETSIDLLLTNIPFETKMELLSRLNIEKLRKAYDQIEKKLKRPYETYKDENRFIRLKPKQNK